MLDLIHAQLIDYLKVNSYSVTPKYVQLANSITDAIRKGIIGLDHPLPSILDMASQLDVAKETVEKGYSILKKQGTIYATPRLGYFVRKKEIDKLNIAFFLNKLSYHKKTVYDSFARNLMNKAAIDLFVYNSDISHLKRLLINEVHHYDYYVVFPYFKEGKDQAAEVLSKISKEKLVLLGRKVDGLTGPFSLIYENYEHNIYTALVQMVDRLSRYSTLKLVFPKNSDYPKEIIWGFQQFCREYAFDELLIGDLSKHEAVVGDCFINITEDTLAPILDKILSKKYKVGIDVGVISYNETPLNRFILDGVTTISTDFELMGKLAAKAVVTNSNDHVEIPFYVRIRNSV